MLTIAQGLAKITDIVGEPVQLVYAKDLIDQTGKVTGTYEYVELTDGSMDLRHFHPVRAYNMTLYIIRPINKLNTSIAHFYLSGFPGCCAFAISTAAEVNSKFVRRGINTIANEIRQRLAKEAGYTTLFCTDVETNTASVRTLAKNGFTTLYKVKNRRTNNPVFLAMKEL